MTPIQHKETWMKLGELGNLTCPHFMVQPEREDFRWLVVLSARVRRCRNGRRP